MKFIDFFSGIGGMRSGLEKSGHECVGFCEFDKFARQSYKAMYNTQGEWESHDVREVKCNEIPKADIWTFGFPCFKADTLILTDKGYIPIQDVKVGDLVLTHKSNWKPVTKVMSRDNAELWEVNGSGMLTTFTTAEHPYYVCREGKLQFVECKNINANTDYSTIAIPPTNDTDTHTELFWWIMGRCIRDGYCVKNTIVLHSNYRHYNKDVKALSKIGFEYNVEGAEHSEHRYIAINNTIFFDKFVKCENISKDILELPYDKLKAFAEGFSQGESWTGITEILMGMQLVENKICHCLLKTQGDINVTRDNVVCRRFSQPRKLCEYATVYNISVQDDESYVANGAVVHNCQDISVAGKQKGLQSGERSGLFYEIMRLLAGLREEDKPEWIIAENVKNLISIGRGFDFLRCLLEMGAVGYDVEWQLFNTKYSYVADGTYIPGIPQNRERIYLVGHLASKCTKQILPIPRANEQDYYEFRENAGTNSLIEETQDEPLIIDDTLGFDGIREYEGQTPTLRSERSGLKVVLPALTPERAEKRQNDRRFKEDGEPMFTLTAQDRHGVAIIDDQGRLNKVCIPKQECPTLRSEVHGNVPKVIDIYNKKIKEGEVGTITANSNTITTHCGTMLVVENEPKVVGGVGEKNFGKQFRQGNRIYSTDGVSPALTTNAGNASNGSVLISLAQDQAILTPKRTEYGKEIRKEYEKHEIQEQRKNMVALEPRQDGITNTLTTVTKDNLLVDSVGSIKIRRLTPKECWRLQGFTDEQHDKVEAAGVSESQRYKQAGNAISVNIAYAIGMALKASI